jgi:hypothetical protein
MANKLQYHKMSRVCAHAASGSSVEVYNADFIKVMVDSAPAGMEEDVRDEAFASVLTHGEWDRAKAACAGNSISGYDDDTLFDVLAPVYVPPPTLTAPISIPSGGGQVSMPSGGGQQISGAPGGTSGPVTIDVPVDPFVTPTETPTETLQTPTSDTPGEIPTLTIAGKPEPKEPPQWRAVPPTQPQAPAPAPSQTRGILIGLGLGALALGLYALWARNNKPKRRRRR